MKISTKGRYALRIMLDLASNIDKKCVTVKEISDRQEISTKYIEQIIKNLRAAGYVSSTRGAHGGYSLAVKPEQCSVGMILRVTEGDLAPVACLEKKGVPCKRSAKCTTIEVWQQIQNAVDNVIDNITLADLLKKQDCQQAI